MTSKRDILTEAKEISEGMRRLRPEAFAAVEASVKQNCRAAVRSGLARRAMAAGRLPEGNE